MSIQSTPSSSKERDDKAGHTHQNVLQDEMKAYAAPYRRLLLRVVVSLGVFFALIIACIHQTVPYRPEAMLMRGHIPLDETETLAAMQRLEASWQHTAPTEKRHPIVEKRLEQSSVIKSASTTPLIKQRKNTPSSSSMRIANNPHRTSTPSDQFASQTFNQNATPETKVQSHTKDWLIDAGRSPISTFKPLPQSALPNTIHSSSTTPPLPESTAKSRLTTAKTPQNKSMMQERQTPSDTSLTIRAGTLIPAILQTGLQSDLPGTVIAKVRQGVYDSATGNTLLIPPGTTLLGTYQNDLSIGQSRLFVVWRHLLFPSGLSFLLQSFPAVDNTGQTGLSDQVNRHLLQTMSSIFMMSIIENHQPDQQLSVGQSLSQPQLMISALREALHSGSKPTLNATATQPPTISIRPGALFNVLLTQDLVLSESISNK